MFEYGILPVNAAALDSAESAAKVPVCQLNLNPVRLSNPEIVRVHTMQQCFQMAGNGRVHYIFGPKSVLQYFRQLFDFGPETEYTAFHNLFQAPLSLYASRKLDKEISRRLGEALKDIDIQAIIKRNTTESPHMG